MPKKPHEEHENHERYLVTYADLITLLLGLFVILYASSKADTPKYIAISNALRNIFNGSGRVLDVGGARGGAMPKLPNPSKAGGDVGLGQLQIRIMEALEILPPDSSVAGADSSRAQGGQKNKGGIQIELQERGLVIHLSESMFFDSGLAEIKPEGLEVLDLVAPALRSTVRMIRVEGHTDNTPIHTERFPSNWHLSAVRAINTATYLIDQHRIPSTRVSVAGYGEFRPVVPNETPEQRQTNRRVDLVILSTQESSREPVSLSEAGPDLSASSAPHGE
jgi:chemotaxis protein MotB